MLLLKPLSIVISTALTAFTAAQSDDTPATLHFFDENFEPRNAVAYKAFTDDFSSSSSLAGTRMPRKCIDDLTKGKSPKSRECDEWIKANPGFVPTLEPTTMAPTPFFHVSSSFKDTASSTNPVMEVKLKPTDDTFLEVWRPDEPLGDRTKLKIDAMEGIPTKVIMLKFALGHVLREYHEGDTQGMNATLTGARLRLFAITDTHFGGYVSEIDSDWDEETAVWDDYVKKGKRGSYERSAAELLPDGRNDVIGEFDNVTEGGWYEADLTKRLVAIFDEDKDGFSGQLSLRMTTDSADGVIYASKEYEGLSPELILDFTFTGGEAEEDDLEPNVIELTGSPVATPKEDVTETFHPTGPPSNAPIAITQSPSATPDTAIDTEFVADETAAPTPSPSLNPTTKKPIDTEFVADETAAPTPSPSLNPTTKKPTKAPVTTKKEVESVEDSTTSVVSSSFKMTITAIEELFRVRNLRHDGRDLSVFMSVEEKERPALKNHLLHVSKIILDNPPEDIMLSFEDDVIVETIEKSSKNNGGVTRTSTFRVIGEFNEEDVKGTTTAQLAALLDQTITYAFVGFQKKSFLEILSNTGRAIYSRTASQDVSVTKINYSAANSENGDGLAFATNNGNEMVSQSEEATETGTWIQPTLIAGAAMLFVATASASLLVFKLKNGSQQSFELEGKPDESPRSLEETAAPSTPSPGMFADRWKKKKFDYAEFQDDPDAEDSACEMYPTVDVPTTSKYFGQPARDIKFSHFMNSSFEDSSISDVSQCHMLGAKGSMKENEAAKEDSSQAESHLLDTTMDSYNMDTMSELNARLENVLQLDGASPREKLNQKADDASHLTVNSNVPSELYSDINSTESPMQYDYDTGAAYASHLITLDMMKNNDMPPPPSDVASDTSSYQDDKLADVDQNLHFDCLGGAEERLIQRAKSYQVEDAVCPKTKTEMINDELSKVMKLLQTPSKDGADAECFGSPESSAEIYIPSESDTESASMSSMSVVGGLLRDGNQQDSQPSDDRSVSSTEALNNTVPASQDHKESSVDAQNDGINVLVKDDSDGENDENDPLQAMNVALNECMAILDKAAA